MSKGLSRDFFSLEEKFGQYLVAYGYLTEAVFKQILSSKKNGENVLNLLVRKGYLSEDELLEAKSSFLGIPRISLAEETLDISAVQMVSENLAIKYTLIPVRFEGEKLLVAMSDPMNICALDDISVHTGFQVKPLLAGAEEIKIAIRQHLTLAKSIHETEKESAPKEYRIWQVEDGEENGINREASVVRLVDSFLGQAVMEGASDIHWEPKEKEFLVRFRVDGMLVKKSVLPSRISRSMAARLKIMAGMDVAERRIPQDGRIVLEINGKRIDVRASTFPTVYGEKVVTRILDSETAELSLAELGMREEVETGVRGLLRHPYGLILVSGPTGSGKTTTLYALLRELQSESLNIVSIEDPVEYRLAGVNQAQVNSRIGLDFARGLRAILRQDPDVIMVGEVRDRETAKIATAAALTGHLVFTTVHTNTASEALARLLDMDIEPYLVASAICGVIAQRLVRRLCPYCKEKHELSEEMRKILLNPDSAQIYRPKGCVKCRGTGYIGRIGVHEILPYNQCIKEMVLKKKSSAEIEEAAREAGMLSLKEDAVLKAEKGLTSLEEVFRITAGI